MSCLISVVLSAFFYVIYVSVNGHAFDCNARHAFFILTSLQYEEGVI